VDECLVYTRFRVFFLQMHIESMVWNAYRIDMVWNEREWITIKDYRYSRDVVLCCVVLWKCTWGV
jgi:hypothetical protein